MVPRWKTESERHWLFPLTQMQTIFSNAIRTARLSHCSWTCKKIYYDSRRLDFLPANVATWSVPSNLRGFQSVTFSGTPPTHHHCLISICHQMQGLPLRMLNQAMTFSTFRDIHQAVRGTLCSSFFIRRRWCKVQVIIRRIAFFTCQGHRRYVTIFLFDVVIIWNNDRCTVQTYDRLSCWWQIFTAVIKQIPGIVWALKIWARHLDEPTTPGVVRLETAFSDSLQHIRHFLKWKSKTVSRINDHAFQMRNIPPKNHAVSPFNAELCTIRQHTCFAAMWGDSARIQNVPTCLEQLAHPELHLRGTQRSWRWCTTYVGRRHDWWLAYHQLHARTARQPSF